MTQYPLGTTLFLLAALTTAPLFAAKPAPPAPPAPAESDGFTRVTGQIVIDKPGLYRVMNDFEVKTGIAILIKTDNVTLDLNQHTLTGNPENPTIAFADQVGINNTRVTGGTLIGGHHGIDFQVAGVGVRKRIRVDHLKVRETSAAAIEIAGNPDGAGGRVEAIVEDNQIYNQNGTCFFGIILAQAYGGRVKNNVVSGCQRGLLLNFSENNWVSGNIITENSYAGIALEQSRFNRIEDNQLSSNRTFAISLTGSNNVIERNVFMNTEGTGLSIQPGPSFASIGNIYAQNRGNCAQCYAIVEGNIDAGGNLPAPVPLPPITLPRRKRP